MKSELILGLCIGFCTTVLAGVSPFDDCLVSPRTSCSAKEPCPPGSRCIGGRCLCTIRPVFCPSGVTGPTCSIKEPCKKGYSCRLGRCCRDEGCPARWLSDGPCNLKPGGQKCKTGYNCINNYCCRPKIIDPVRKCPKGQIQVPGSCVPLFPLPSKVPVMKCPPGSTCYKGICCRSSTKPECPKGKIQTPGICFAPSALPGDIVPFPTCRKPATCYKGICCRDVPYPDPAVCPTGQTQVPGTCIQVSPIPPGKWPPLRCPRGSTCYKGMCCRPDNVETCQKGHMKVPGQCPKCPTGSKCYNGICCRPIITPPFPTRCPKFLELSAEQKATQCPINKKSPDQCQTSIDCLRQGKGRLCCDDRCGRKYCFSPFIIRPPFPGLPPQ